MNCGSNRIKKYGKVRGRQRFQCLVCYRQFIPKRDRTALQKRLWNEYVWHRQTLSQLAEQCGRSIPWVQRQLDAAAISVTPPAPQPVVAVTDTTFFGRGYGILVIRCPRLKKNVHWQEVRLETPDEYQRARQALEARGFMIDAAVIDGKRGVQAVFHDIPVQFCQFHQIAIVRRYLTSRPKLPAGKELRAITFTLPATTQKTFTDLLAVWYKRHEHFLKERTYTPDSRHWQYTHRRIRSAYRSLRVNLPHLFTYQNYPHLKIPNTTNSLDGYFSKLKHLLNTHRGLTIQRRYKLIQQILGQ